MSLFQNAFNSIGILLYTCNLKDSEEVPVTHEFGPFIETRDEGVLQISVLDADTSVGISERSSIF